MQASLRAEFHARLEHSLRKDLPLATLVSILRKIQRLMADERAGARDLAAALHTDPVLTAKILRLVNAAAMGLERKVANLDEAVVFLGYARLKAVAAGTLALDILQARRLNPCWDPVALWTHALGTAAAAGALQTQFLPERPAADLFTAGLLANIGRILLEQWFQEETARIHAVAVEQQVPMIEAERRVLGTTHAEVGFWVAEAWHFDEPLARIIRYHHGPGVHPHTDYVNLAYVMTHALLIGSPGEPHITPLLPGVLTRLHMDDFRLDSVLRLIAGAHQTVRPILQHMGANNG